MNTGSHRRSNRIQLIISILTACLSLVTMIMIAMSLPFFNDISDLPEYYATGRMVIEGKGAYVYDVKIAQQYREQLFPGLKGRALGVFSPPPALLLLVPLALVPLAAVNAVWLIFLVACFVASLYILRKKYRLDRVSFLWLWGLAWTAGPVFEAIRIEQLATMLLLTLCLTLFCLSRKKDLAAGLLISVFIFKPQYMVPFGIYLLAARRWKPAVVAFLSIGVLSVLALLICSPECYEQFFHFATNLGDYKSTMVPELTPTVRGQLLRFGLGDQIISLAAGTCLIATFCYCAWLSNKFKSSAKWLDAGVIAVWPLALVTAPFCHSYDLVLLIPTFVALFNTEVGHSLPNWVGLLSMAAIGVFFIAVSQPIHYQYLTHGGVVNPFFWSIFALALAIAVTIALRIGVDGAVDAEKS